MWATHLWDSGNPHGEHPSIDGRETARAVAEHYRLTGWQIKLNRRTKARRSYSRRGYFADLVEVYRD